MAVFAFSGGAPGSMLMPSRWVRGSGNIGGWQSFAVGWSLGATQNFMMAYSQVYNYPSMDPVMPHCTSQISGDHTWYYYGGAWARFSSLGYGNAALAIRCVVSDINPAVAPSSFGRVKAMYH